MRMIQRRRSAKQTEECKLGIAQGEDFPMVGSVVWAGPREEGKPRYVLQITSIKEMYWCPDGGVTMIVRGWKAAL